MSITQQEYIERNLKGFEGDDYLKSEIENLIKRFNIKTVIETGTFRGGTTKVLSGMVETVHTIEIDENYYELSKAYLKKYDNVILHNGSTEQLLEEVIKQSKGNLLFFLDAHFYDYCPLLDELKVIAKQNIKPVIVIHDFKVPGRPELGFDSYNGQDYEFEWIRLSLERIYDTDYHYYYNEQSNGAMRGVIYIVPSK